MVLNIWIWHARSRSNETYTFEMVSCTQARSEQDPLDPNLQFSEVTHVTVKRDWLFAMVLHEALQVVHQVEPNARQMMNDVDTDALQVLSIPNT
eukprot:CAMPEP_0174299652 /NCGR_PEP_ID=MMETSP0809-20121228/57274_1 /TAXON_ID=73025 ORGANISM="Eutreptiella gymnastica-like, Strain CCMP1594" /NCGR_SAMPLE_ID=MMETSP0809 /ASSEMBLY_ACC=CAM_ASM_000658 /LENGTH=93 /DNA_ID=CAMNT_0015404981 /DNA_START=132 /DNA_END=413 /DNA_ORIENTATION=+